MSATWGFHIPGYSSPSAAQQKLFKKCIPSNGLITLRRRIKNTVNDVKSIVGTKRKLKRTDGKEAK